MSLEEMQSTRPGGAILTLRGMSFGYGATALFSQFSCDVRAGVTCILGRSGGGKSTFLRLAGGLETPQAGSVSRAPGQKLAWMGASALLPWASTLDNVLLGARLRGERPDRDRAVTLLKRLGLGGVLRERPAALSSGMQQRVALARCLMEDADLTLMDEPFSALDAMTKRDLQDLTLKSLGGRSAVLVTHDPFEALRVATRILVFAGRPVRVAADIMPPGPAPRDPRSPQLDRAYAQILAALEAA